MNNIMRNFFLLMLFLGFSKGIFPRTAQEVIAEIKAVNSQLSRVEKDSEKEALMTKELLALEEELEGIEVERLRILSNSKEAKEIKNASSGDASAFVDKFPQLREQEDLCKELVFVTEQLFDVSTMTKREKIFFASFEQLVQALIEEEAFTQIKEICLLVKQIILRLESLTISQSELVSPLCEAVLFPLERVDVQHVAVKVIAHLVDFVERNYDAVVASDSTILKECDLAQTILAYLPNRMKRYAWRRVFCYGRRRRQAQDAMRVKSLLSYNPYAQSDEYIKVCENYLRLMTLARKGVASSVYTDLLDENRKALVQQKRRVKNNVAALTYLEVIRANSEFDAQRVKLVHKMNATDSRAEVCIRHTVLCDNFLLMQTCDEEFIEAYFNRYKAIVDQYLEKEGIESFAFKYELFALSSQLKRFRGKDKITASFEARALVVPVNVTSHPLEWFLNKCAGIWHIIKPADMTYVYTQEMIDVLMLIAANTSKVESKDEIEKAEGVLESVLSGSWSGAGAKASFMGQAKGIIRDALKGNISDLKNSLTGAVGGAKPYAIAAVLYMVMPALLKRVKPFIRDTLFSWLVENGDEKEDTGKAAPANNGSGILQRLAVTSATPPGGA